MVKERCIGCGDVLPVDPALRSISHTIKPDEAVLCTKCGVLESVNPAWASGRRIAILRAEAAMKAMDEHKAQTRKR